MAFDDLCPSCGGIMSFKAKHFFNTYDAWVCDGATGCGYEKIIL